VNPRLKILIFRTQFGGEYPKPRRVDIWRPFYHNIDLLASNISHGISKRLTYMDSPHGPLFINIYRTSVVILYAKSIHTRVISKQLFQLGFNLT
jgi:hypothetical protein